MSELKAGHPPCPKMRRAALAGSPNRKIDFNEPAESNEMARDFQAASLRRRFALGYCLAVALAPLVWELPR